MSKSSQRLRLNTGCFAALFCASFNVTAELQYRASVLEFNGDLQQYRVADFNGDGRNDVLVVLMPSEQDPTQAQDIRIYWQAEDGGFSNRPNRIIPFKKDILSFSYGDVRSDPGDELVFFTREGAYSFSTLKESYADNIQRLISWPLAQTYRDKEGVRYINALQDLNGDGELDLLLPGETRYGVFLQRSNQFDEVRELPVSKQVSGSSGVKAELGFDMRRGLSFATNDIYSRASLVPQLNVSPLPGELQRDDEPLLVSEHWQSAVMSHDIDNDRQLELVYLDNPRLDEEDKNQRRLNILSDTFVHIAPKNSTHSDDVFRSRALLPSTSVVNFVDWDGDDVKELVTRDHKEAGGATLALYQQTDSHLGAPPHQILKFSGYDVDVEFVDIDMNRSPEMLVSYYSLSAASAVRGGNMLRTLLIYESENLDGQVKFKRRPSVKFEEKFSSDNFRGLTQRIDISEDFDGDARLDALSVDQEGALMARKIESSLQIQAEAYWRFVPLHAITWFQSLRLNNDQKPDLALSHQRSLTLLASVEDGGVNE
ncbi:hypothetical protein NBRC116494_07750 [Aurantivibrio plasticivorans]